MNVLLSIKPEFADKILDGEKQYEFRRSAFQDASEVDTVFLYSSSPVQRVVGAITIGDVVEDEPRDLWKRFGDSSGMSSRERFLQYFDGAMTGYAIEIGKSYRLSNSINPRTFVSDFVPPVSFYYLGDELQSVLESEIPESLLRNKSASLTQYGSD